MEINKQELGIRIRDIRNKRLESMEKFGQAIANATNNQSKSGKSNVSRWERGENIPNNETLKAIADLGGISVNALIYGDKSGYIKKVIEDELDSGIYSYWNEYINKYKDNIIRNIINDIESNPNIISKPITELKGYTLDSLQGYILDAITDTKDMLIFTIGELKRIKSRIKIYIGENMQESNLKVDEIDIQTANKVITNLDETIENIMDLY